MSSSVSIACARLFEDFNPIFTHIHEYEFIQFAHEEEEDDVWADDMESEAGAAYDDEEDDENFCRSCGFVLETEERLFCTECCDEMRSD